jgi:anti-anti-sigma factor
VAEGFYAINLQAGAKTGLASMFNGVFVAITLLFLTPYLYHLPKAVLAVIILLAVTSLVTPEALKHTWKASRVDGIVAAVTFFVTLLAAPHLDKGILIGTALALVLFLYRTMKPRVAILGRHADGTLRDAKINRLPASDVVTAVRFDGRLYFANVAYFEDAILDAVANNPNAPYVLIVGDGINDIDASGEEVIHHLVERLSENGIVILFSGLKKQVHDVMRATGLRDIIGEKRFFDDRAGAERIYPRAEYADVDDPRPRRVRLTDAIPLHDRGLPIWDNPGSSARRFSPWATVFPRSIPPPAMPQLAPRRRPRTPRLQRVAAMGDVDELTSLLGCSCEERPPTCNRDRHPPPIRPRRQPGAGRGLSAAASRRGWRPSTATTANCCRSRNSSCRAARAPPR